MSTPIIKVVLDKRRALKNSQSNDNTLVFPVKLRVTYQRTQRYFKLNLRECSEKDWNKIIEGARMSKKQREVFHGMREAEARALDIVEYLNPFSFHAFKSTWYSNQPVKAAKSFKAFFNQYIDSLKSEGRHSTASSYNCALVSLLKFQNFIDWSDISPEFLLEYEKYMTDNGKSANTIGIYLRSLRAVVNSAIAKGLFNKEHYPFGRRAHGKYPIPANQNKKRALVADEVQLIKNHTPKAGSRAERAQYFWLFSYYMNGCNIKDVAYLTWKNIDFKEGVVQFVRKKTERANSSKQVMITAVINDHVKATIEKFGGSSKDPEEFVFSIINRTDTGEVQYRKIKEFVRQLNIGLKQLAKELELEKNITTYTARHSHAYALFSNDVSLEVIMDQFKHSNINTTMNYIDSISNEKRKDVAKLL